MFTWQEINEDWLGGGNIALSSDETARAFNLVADRFGRAWVEASRLHSGVVTRGTSPTLEVVMLGLWLETLGESPNSEHLLNKVRDGLPDARAELCATYLVRSGLSNLDLEIEPTIIIGNRNRSPDFRVRTPDEGWIYVEVTQPNTSRAQADVHRALDRLTGLVDGCDGSFALEVFLKRDPTPDEIEAIATEITNRHGDSVTEDTELDADLGTLYWNAGPPGTAILDDHGLPYVPRLGAMRVAVRGEARRHIFVRWPFTDARAQAFLDSESKQLPRDAPGLIMIQTGYAAGAMRSWHSLIERRFQPNIYTRVSAVCLFSSGQVHTPAGEEWRPATKLIHNPHARFPLPDWLAAQLERFRADEPDRDPT